MFSDFDWLVVSNIFYFPFHIWDVILPIDELHHFSRWLLHHQPVDDLQRKIKDQLLQYLLDASLLHLSPGDFIAEISPN